VGGFLIIIIVLGLAWFLLAVPARRRRNSHEAMQDSVDVGDEVITAGGIHGTVREIDDDVVELEIAPSVVVKLDRRAIAAVATEIEAEPEPDHEPELDDGHETEPEGDAEPERDSAPAAEKSPEPG
jgi:preprotein translocase subunit YajC